MEDKGLPVFITIIVSSVIIGVFVFAAAIINAVLNSAL